MKGIAILIVFMCITSCSSVKVNYDYDKATDFTNYSTYSYYPQMQTGLNDLDTRRLIKAVDSTMRLKGMLYSEEAEFLINIKSTSYINPQNSSVGVGVGGTSGSVGGGVSIGVPIGGSRVEREIVFDFVDPQKDALFWQAVSSGALSDNASPSSREEKIQQIVQKVFSNYPPNKKK